MRPTEVARETSDGDGWFINVVPTETDGVSRIAIKVDIVDDDEGAAEILSPVIETLGK